ncbi:Flp pilus assembly protein CpaB [Rhodoblastus acidophilus]|uniref:Flp pilus assembly protein CpaB n=1 Tax=Candidatus Rhodoblastus alkanivorans TaxID=2954117 RepID=A0ABS9ZAI5_9HYPH|nr:Flp pilus assembly protein CpaB [Candidatus Rhodoblastus alkanivorans]MCI4677802.1 Flp pilus assembly protein CpaB [Candidatus Rhodoblastus alkanivorans]MCI4684700.1 Flp pilus assembly protein CpaB [Candidatus Rhodoblastus alkanivorans]MDI4642022.1 Flp pilus assembly protein CpaB [Rhodoblastus acidophilus]
MKKARLIFLGVVLASGVGASYLVLSRPEPPPPVRIVQAPRAAASAQVLVAAHELNFGSVLQPSDLAWHDWPKDDSLPGLIYKSAAPNAMNDIKDSVVRGSILAGEPIRREKLFKGGASGYLSAMLTPGYRAVAINIEGSGATTAGNFILPNDRVDVIRIYRDEDAAKSGAGDAYVSETIVQNVRVLAIGQNTQDKNGQPYASGTTATLELTPAEAEAVILAQRVGQLSLVLRSMQDSQPSSVPVAVNNANHDRAITVVRAGVATQSRGK